MASSHTSPSQSHSDVHIFGGVRKPWQQRFQVSERIPPYKKNEFAVRSS